MMDTVRMLLKIVKKLLFLVWKVFSSVLYWVFIIPLFPFYVMEATDRPWLWPTRFQLFYKRWAIKLLALFVLLPLWVFFYYKTYTLVDRLFINRIGIIQVSGTGSMYPTFPEGMGTTLEEKTTETVAEPVMLVYPNGIFLNETRYLGYQLGRGDIVSFKNQKTMDNAAEKFGIDAYVKRIIGLPGDTIELRDGLVYLNNMPLMEPYTALPHSTFGGEFLPECTEKKIPAGNYFVLGDNRKKSNDSRQELGFIAVEDIDFVLTREMQRDVWDQNFRNTINDLDPVSRIQLDVLKFVEELNSRRTKQGIAKLKINEKLNNSALLRAKNIMKTNDFTFNGETSGYSMENSLQASGYFNRAWGEIPLQGYYTDEELIENIFHFENSAEFVLGEDFDDVGIATHQGLLNDCPTQLIVLHFGGYVPPNYAPDVVSSWKELLEGLIDVEASWETLLDYEQFYKDNRKEVDRINEIIDIRLKNVGIILEKMEGDLWLSDEENAYIDLDPELSAEQNNLADYLNKKGKDR